MDEIKIIHISDLHISEHLTRGASDQFKLPARYGHNIQVFLALDKFLKESQWDILLITGDLTRIGNSESFESIRNWLENQINIGAYTLGLNLSKSETQCYYVIPGNHDRFNGELTQNSLDKYHHEFLPITSGEVKSLHVGKNKVNIHLYDSTQDNKSFAYGYIDEKSLIPPTCPEGELNLALLHHHFIQPPKHERSASTELMNSADVAAFFLNSGFDGVLFGHTHQSYIGNPSIESLAGILKDKRIKSRFWKRILPKYILRQLEGNCLVSYKRESAQNGQLPTLESYFDYLTIKKYNDNIKRPSQFEKINLFYEHLGEFTNEPNMKGKLSKLKMNSLLISLAPSACQDEAKWKGLHEITFKKDGDKYLPTWNRYQFDGAKFAIKENDEHAS